MDLKIAIHHGLLAIGILATTLSAYADGGDPPPPPPPLGGATCVYNPAPNHTQSVCPGATTGNFCAGTPATACAEPQTGQESNCNLTPCAQILSGFAKHCVPVAPPSTATCQPSGPNAPRTNCGKHRKGTGCRLLDGKCICTSTNQDIDCPNHDMPECI
jgi:hypothetical protein